MVLGTDKDGEFGGDERGVRVAAGIRLVGWLELGFPVVRDGKDTVFFACRQSYLEVREAPGEGSFS